MRLTLVLCKFKRQWVGPQPKYPGTSYIGKHRFVPPVTRFAKYYMLRMMMYEEETMKYLENPYITQVQEQAYLQSVGRTHPEYYDEFMYKKVVKPERQRYSSDLLERLDVGRKFEIQE